MRVCVCVCEMNESARVGAFFVRRSDGGGVWV